MNDGLLAYIEFRRRHLGTFMIGIYLGLFSAAIALVVALTSYLGFLSSPAAGKFFFGGSVCFALVQTFVGGMLVQGRLKWVWGNIGLFLVCFFATLPAFFYFPDRLVFWLGMLSPLAGILWVNTARYERMCQALREMHFYRLEAKAEFRAKRQSGRNCEALLARRKTTHKSRS